MRTWFHNSFTWRNKMYQEPVKVAKQSSCQTEALCFLDDAGLLATSSSAIFHQSPGSSWKQMGFHVALPVAYPTCVTTSMKIILTKNKVQNLYAYLNSSCSWKLILKIYSPKRNHKGFQWSHTFNSNISFVSQIMKITQLKVKWLCRNNPESLLKNILEMTKKIKAIHQINLLTTTTGIRNFYFH